MATAQHIEPFPADIDRDAFGHWLSGFVDGEGSFALYHTTGQKTRYESLRASLRICLRDDDAPILSRIQSYWSCGVMSSHATNKGHPAANITIVKLADLVSVVIPHFERFPLRAKKRNDFTIWKAGVTLMQTVAKRPHPSIGVSWHVQRGTTKWSDSERRQFKRLEQQLKSSRCYDPSTITPHVTDKPSIPSLFSDIDG